jgi:hypothetical protein
VDAAKEVRTDFDGELRSCFVVHAMSTIEAKVSWYVGYKKKVRRLVRRSAEEFE